MSDKTDRHPSLGMISWGRSSGKDISLFGSELNHDHLIHITVSGASRVRDLNKDRYHDEDVVVDLHMSAAQFSEFITTPNTTGVPCTIRHRIDHDGLLEYPGHKSLSETVVNDFSE